MSNVPAASKSELFERAETINEVIKLLLVEQIGIIFIDNPPVNAGNFKVRQGIVTALASLEKADAQGAVLIGAAKSFISGSDLKEFGLPLAYPEVPDVIEAVETASFPIVAALSGGSLGGGYELALGCDARVASLDTLVGLPEVKLGIIPGAGGTQRLPRLVGIPIAIELICKGERVPARRALDLGMVDKISNDDLLGDAIQYARRLAGSKHIVKNTSPKPYAADEVQVVEKAAVRRGKGLPAVELAIASIKRAETTPVDEALKLERETFHKLRIGAEASALRYQFFAERQAQKPEFLAGLKPTAKVTHVAVIGAGTMGAGIAVNFLQSGYSVTLIERDDASLSAGVDRIKGLLAKLEASGRATQDDLTLWNERLSPSIDVKDVSQVDLIIEVVIEELNVKQELFGRIETHAKPDAIIASNTSYLDIDAIAQGMKEPSRLVGMHFFSPAHIMRLLEVVTGKVSAKNALATVFAIGRKLGKAPVFARSSDGFIGNRIYSAYRQQCEFMVEEGAMPHDIDAALKSFGFAMGPFAVSDLSGLDIAWARRKRLAATRSPDQRYVDIADRYVKRGTLGAKQAVVGMTMPIKTPARSPPILQHSK